MDQLPSFGTAISAIVQPTFKTYVPLLLPNASAIKSTKSQTFSYGAHPRQQLDVYYPKSDDSGSNKDSSSSPVFVFLYGGGLIRGDKILPMMPQGLVHANVGHFFAEKYGFTVVIPDYRLVGEAHGAKFPSGGEDLSLVVDWMLGNLVSSGGKERELYMMGNSAGGVHMSTYLFGSMFAESRAKVLGGGKGLSLKRAVELSVPFHFGKAEESRMEVLEAFYGSDVQAHCPMGLLKSVLEKDGGVGKSLPGVKFLVLNGSLDPEDEIMDPRDDFVELWNTKGKPAEGELLVEMMEGHNHISPVLSLGTGREKEEAWGHQVGKFCSSGGQ